MICWRRMFWFLIHMRRCLSGLVSLQIQLKSKTRSSMARYCWINLALRGLWFSVCARINHWNLLQKYIDMAVSLDGLSPYVPLYKVTEGNEPCFFTTFFSWDSSKATVCLASYAFMLFILISWLLLCSWIYDPIVVVMLTLIMVATTITSSKV